jgi:hypothetical protein
MQPSRSVVLEPYGVALTKLKARSLGINPVWYIDQTPGRDWVLSQGLDALRDWTANSAEQSGQAFHIYYLARIFPFIEQMGTWPSAGTQKEFWWEREWRHVGPVTLPLRGVIWLCKAEEHAQLEVLAGGRLLRPWIDPRWGLERIIAHLAGFSTDEITPFPEP